MPLVLPATQSLKPAKPEAYRALVKTTPRDLLQNEEEMDSWVRTLPGSGPLTLLQ